MVVGHRASRFVGGVLALALGAVGLGLLRRRRRAFSASGKAGRILCGLLTALAALALSGRASAHGGIPRAFEILENKAKPEQFVIRSDVWGFFHSSDGGKHWQWSCSIGYGTPSTTVNRVEMALTAKGRLLVANGFSGFSYTDDFCSWSHATGLAPAVDGGSSLLLWDVAVLADGTVLALSSTGSASGLSNEIWASQDDGATFTLARDLGQPDDTYTSLAQAPSRANRVYIVGAVIGAPKTAVLRTDDGGATYQRLDGPPITDTRMVARIHAVHPTNPDLVFVWLDLPEVERQDSPDEIWFSSDAGSTWRPLVQSQGDMPGLAFSPDGKTIAVGGTLEGVRRGSVQAVIDGGMAELSQVNPRPAWGLFWNENGLHAGKDNFTSRGTPETFTVGISHDEGETFEQLVSICDFEFSHCPAGTVGHDMCEADWEDPDPLKGGFKQDFWVNSGRCVGVPDAGEGGVANDAGVARRPPKDEHGCSCSTPGTSAPSGALVALSLSALGLGFRRRSRK
jgi:MYXO-CTERM domain-containing protein